MKPNNENVKNFIITNYIDSPIEPRFAVLIKGKWGCGKTFFLDTVLKEKYGEKYKKENVIWLSLYGLSNISQLNQKFYEACHPILTHKVTKFALQMVKSAARIQGGFDLTNDNVNDLSFDFSLPEFQDDENNIKTKRLLVVDDLERCSIPPEQILGFFSDYILEKNLKTIFIGNTDEIGNKKGNVEERNAETQQVANDRLEFEKESAEKSDFEKIKEKVIGVEFTIFPETKEAIEKFVTEIQIPFLQKELCEICFAVVQQLKFENLRVLRQGFYFLKQLILNYSQDDIQKYPLYFKSVILYFFVIYTQKSSGNIRKDDVEDTIEAYVRNKSSFLEYRKQIKKDVYHFNYAKIPLKSSYADIVFDGIIDRDEVRKDFENWTSPKDERPAYIRILQDWIELSDSDFKNLYNEALQEFKSGEFQYYAQLLNFANMELILSFYGLINKNCTTIKKSILSYAKQHSSKMNHDANFYLVHPYDFNDKTYNDTYKEIVDELKTENLKTTKASLKKDFYRILNSLPESLEELEENIRTYSSRSEYHDYAILNELSITRFYNYIKFLSYENQRMIYNCFCDRYGKAYSNGTLKKQYYPDVKKIKELAECYKKSTKSVLMSPENKQREFIAQWYEELYEWMNNQMGENKQ